MDIEKFGSEELDLEEDQSSNRDELNKLNQDKAEHHGENDDEYAPEGAFRSSKDL
jgi:hypothetical protein